MGENAVKISIMGTFLFAGLVLLLLVALNGGFNGELDISMN